LLDRLHALGASVKTEDGRLVLNVAVGGLPDELKALVAAHKDELLALLRPPAPPPGARLFFESADGKVCWPEEAHHWTYERAPTWYYAAQHPAPPCTPAPAVLPWRPRRCPGCSGRDLRVAWAEVKEGKRQLQVRCNACNAYAGCLRQEPDNPELEWRAA
jgi:hypothetical protein